MSELFSFHPQGAETLEAFNGRLSQFCSEGAVVDVAISVGPGPIISLSLTEPDDIPVEAPMAIQPIVVLLESKVLSGLEAYLAGIFEQLEAVAKSEGRGDTFSIAQTRVHTMASDPNRGYAVIIINLGEISYENRGEGDGQ